MASEMCLALHWGVLAVSCGVLIWYLCVWFYRQRRKRWRDELFTTLAALNRWCGKEFPIVEDVTDYLCRISLGGPIEELGAFRDRLRRTYGRDYADF